MFDTLCKYRKQEIYCVEASIFGFTLPSVVRDQVEVLII